MTNPVWLTHDDSYLVYFCTTLTAPDGPSITEIAAGIALHTQLSPAGVDRSATTASVDVSTLNSTFTASATGRRSFSVQVVVNRETTDANGIEAALVYKTTGYLVVRDNLPSETALAAAQIVDVFPVQIGQPSKSTPAANEVQTLTVPFQMTADAYLGVATIAGS